MSEPNYSKRELDALIKEIYEALSRIETQTTKTNGTVAQLKNKANNTDKLLIAIGAIVATLLVTNGSELINILKLII